ncbi:MAG: hypothetical protein M3N54_15125 [Acidobacteriota bacterium]|nr:hypothetical protein [Acidobacteriota bacterium]
MMGFVAAAVAIVMLAGCSQAPNPAANTEAVAPAVKDSSAMLPLTGRTSASVVPNHLLGNPKLPGGTVGEYDTEGRKYQLFIIETASNQDAAMMLMDAKSGMRDTQLIPWMGGYFGTDGKGPVYVFPKLRYLAGVVGLSKDEADPIARTLATRLK